MSSQITKHFNRPLALASAAFLIHIGTATAADSTGNIQEQMTTLLTGTPPAHSTPQYGPRADTVATPTISAQESVRQVLLGTARFETARTSSDTKSRERLVAYGDRQAAVRQVLLGQRNARDAS
jgi:hypothetical protein